MRNITSFVCFWYTLMNFKYWECNWSIYGKAWVIRSNGKQATLIRIITHIFDCNLELNKSWNSLKELWKSSHVHYFIDNFWLVTDKLMIPTALKIRLKELSNDMLHGPRRAIFWEIWALQVDPICQRLPKRSLMTKFHPFNDWVDLAYHVT